MDPTSRYQDMDNKSKLVATGLLFLGGTGRNFRCSHIYSLHCTDEEIEAPRPEISALDSRQEHSLERDNSGLKSSLPCLSLQNFLISSELQLFPLRSEKF